VPARRSNTTYERLRDEIVSWALPASHPLNEVELAARLGVSRTPVREALMRLSHEGLVESLPGKGWMVTQLSLRDVVELFQVREALEALAARLCAEQGRTESFEELAERFGTLDPADTPGVNAAVTALDEAILGECGNARLATSLREIIGHRMRLRAVSGRQTERIAVANAEHVAICRAIAARDADAAVATTRAHIRASLQTILDTLVTQAGSPASVSL
jgi:GntR family transcriptional regulator, rspAB operon transcriptional repressor